MLPGDEWSVESGVMATPQDMIKFAHSRAKLLVQLPYYQTPIEARVSRVAGGGEYWEMHQSNMFSISGTWFPTNQTRVIEILETPPMDPPPITVAAVKKELLTLQEELDKRDAIKKQIEQEKKNKSDWMNKFFDSWGGGCSGGGDA